VEKKYACYCVSVNLFLFQCMHGRLYIYFCMEKIQFFWQIFKYNYILIQAGPKKVYCKNLNAWALCWTHERCKVQGVLKNEILINKSILVFHSCEFKIASTIYHERKIFYLTRIEKIHSKIQYLFILYISFSSHYTLCSWILLRQ
jgi:hypothetical protein